MKPCIFQVLQDNLCAVFTCILDLAYLLVLLRGEDVSNLFMQVPVRSTCPITHIPGQQCLKRDCSLSIGGQQC